MKNYKELLKAHKAAIPQIEAAVKQLAVSRLDISPGIIEDLASANGKNIRMQAKRIASEDVKSIKIVTTRTELCDRAVEYLDQTIDNSVQVIRDALRFGTAEALDVTAFAIVGDKVEIDPEWLAAKNRQHLIEVNIMKGRILQQCDEVRRSVEGLNALIAGNPNYKTGVLPEDTDRRCIMRLSHDGAMELHPEALDYIGV